MAKAYDTSHGTTITFDSGYFIDQITSVSWSGLSRGSINITTMSDTPAMVFEPAAIFDPGELEVGMLFDPLTVPSIQALSASEAVTVDWGGADKWQSAGGHMSNMTINADDTEGADAVNTATVTIKLSGDITYPA